jgi:1-phosphatidylinositol-4-phosphate 5-kinase
MFFLDSGGFGSTNANNEPSTEIYYLGIIDILTSYSFTKKAEHMWKGLTNEEVIDALTCIRYFIKIDAHLF